MAKSIMSLEKLSGERGLLTAILVQAVRDASSAARSKEAKQLRTEARRWLGGADYRAVLVALGLPDDLVPEFMSSAAVGD